jgi:hypothetical protein
VQSVAKKITLNKTKLLRTLFIILILYITSFNVNAQLKTQQIKTDTATDFNKRRLKYVILTESILYSSSIVVLNNMWYKNYPRSCFHFFNDNDEWLQMDKTGHAATGYYLGKIGYELLKYSGVNENKSVWYGGTLGFVYLTSIEILDGFSEQWGASVGDLAANTLGSAVFIGQQLLFNEQKILIKYSFHQTDYAKQRPELLGYKLHENVIKDYNGHTYWLSANIHSFLKKKSKFPSWLNIAFGYGADGMITGKPDTENNFIPPLPKIDRYRQYYLSLDIDLTRIKTNSKILKALLLSVGFIKIPAPAIEYNTKNGIKFHCLYF